MIELLGSKMATKVLLDTCCFIDYFRKKPEVLPVFTRLKTNDFIGHYSILTDFELWVGVRNRKREVDTLIILRPHIRRGLSLKIARRGGELYSQFKAAGIGPVDALLAATAETYDLMLISNNDKHFRPLAQAEIIKYLHYSDC